MLANRTLDNCLDVQLYCSLVTIPLVFHFHRALAAFLARSLRCSGVMLAADLRPPRLPRFSISSSASLMIFWRSQIGQRS